MIDGAIPKRLHVLQPTGFDRGLIFLGDMINGRSAAAPQPVRRSPPKRDQSR